MPETGGPDLAGEVVGERFEVLRQLGSGGMGVVYEARDRVRDATVALKTLTRLEPSSIYRLKTEFRSLADVVHPNLVRLHELHAHQSLWFFTMDLVRGRPFAEHVRIDSSVAFEETVAAPPDAAAPELPSGFPASPGSGALRETSLRRALLQLGRGVDAIHRAGKIHRDLKPTNVLVTRTGRVVILDFGLVSEQGTGGVGQTIVDDSISGTPSYMSPEQCDAAAAVTPASDWYAIGVMLFEALTGRLPFEGSVHDILFAKRQREAPDPAAIVQDIPADLRELCVELTRRDPARRPAGARILERLEALAGRASPPGAGGDVSGAGGNAPGSGGAAPAAFELPFAGRRAELAALEAAFRATEEGRPVLALVRGEPGMGKSELVRRFLSKRIASGEAVVLAGRCYERERVPFKLLDGLIDALSRHLRALPAVEASRLVPRHVHALARMFPVLGRVEVVAGAPARPLPQDPVVLRRRGAAALTELLARMTDEQPLVLYLDDLHWGDLDGAKILAAVLAAEEAPPVLLVATYRDAEEQTSECLRALLDSEEIRDACNVREIALGPLEPAEVRELLDAAGAGADLDAGRIHRDSQGNPYLAAELVRHAACSGAGGGGAPAPELSEALRARAAQLGVQERLCLELLAVAGRPISERLLAAAASIGDALPAALSALRSTQLARSGEEPGKIVAYHDRIREAVQGELDAATLRARHAALAGALEAIDPDDWEGLAVHHDEAGHAARALDYAVRAADRAAAAFAHGRAVELLERALALEADAARRRAITEQLADCLVAVGRGSEAAAHYVACVPGASAEEASRLQMQAGTQLLYAGHVEMGIAGIRAALEAAGIVWPEDLAEASRALESVVEELSARGLGFTPRPANELPPAVLARLDAYWGAGLGLWSIEPYLERLIWLLLRHLHDALEAGDPLRIARGAFNHVALAGMADPTSLPAWILPDASMADPSDRFLELGERAAALVDDRRVELWRERALGYRAQHHGRPAEALEHFGRALEVALERCAGVAREIADIRIFIVEALRRLGRLRPLHRTALSWAEEARGRGDLFGESWQRISERGYLFDDLPEAALTRLEQALTRWSRADDYLSWDAVQVRAGILLYARRVTEAFEIIEPLWRWSLEQSIALIPTQSSDFLWNRAHIAIAVAHSGPNTQAGKTALRECADELERWALPVFAPFSRYLRAELALLDGAADDAQTLAATLLPELKDPENAYELAVRMRLGEIIGGEEGARITREAAAALRAVGIVNPARFRPGPRG